MKGWQIFVHSVRQVTGNLPQALRVSGMLYLIQIVIALVLGINLLAGDDLEAASSADWAKLIVLIVISTGSALWIAVAWHRYILLVETPSSFLPTLHADRILAYLGRSLLVGLLLVPLVLVLSMVAGLIAVSLGGAGEAFSGILVALVLIVPLLLVGMRLSASLPGAALGSDAGIGAAWRSTAGQSGPLLVLAIALALGGFLVDLPGALLMGQLQILATAWLFATGWIKTMVGISVLTTLYGHYIEGRKLNQV